MSDADAEFEAILEKIRAARNFDFRNYKRATLRRRIERRMADRRCRTLREYAALLDREPAEYDAAIGTVLIKVTSFFRDADIWQALANTVVPQIVASKRAGEPLRAWCAGCATGEEAYSVAIVIADVLGAAYPATDVKVFGTDVDEAAVAFARRGVYSAASVEHVSPDVRERWFAASPEGYSVRKEIRRAVVFGTNNLVSNAPISRLDLVVCRNVFIYLDAKLQKRVLSRFHYALRQDGFLVLGRSELIPFASKIFDVVDVSRRIYRKDGARERVVPEQGRLVGLLDGEPVQREDVPPEAPRRQEASLVARLYRDVIDALSVPAIATTTDGVVTVWNLAAARFWGRVEGEVMGRRLATLGLAGLDPELVEERAARVASGRSERESADGVVSPFGRTTELVLHVEVVAMRGADREPAGLLYVAHDVTAVRALEANLRKVNDDLVAANERLQATNERMRTANEELETTNEELQSANEELQTTNEELQSTNEELETTNEELQSANEELDAINRELAHRTEEMHVLEMYKRAIIKNLTAAIVLLDPAGKVTSWNLAAERLLGVTEGEAVGQSFWSVKIRALPRGVVARIHRALSEGRALRIDAALYELPSGGRGHAALAAVPLVEGDTALGAVVLFEDVTRMVTLSDRNDALARENRAHEKREKAGDGGGARPARTRARAAKAPAARGGAKGGADDKARRARPSERGS